MAGYRIDIKTDDKGRILTVPCGITFIQLSALVDIAMGYKGGGSFSDEDEEILGMAEIDDYFEDDSDIVYSCEDGSCTISCEGFEEDYNNNFAVCSRVYGDHENSLVISSNLKNVIFVRKDNDIEHDDFTVWEDADTDEWAKLYELGEEMENLAPWDTFSDVDLICVPTQDDFAYIAVMGAENMSRGISVFFGTQGLNDYLLLRMSGEAGIDSNYAMFSQTGITAYWGNEEDILPDQLKRIEKLGKSGRGKGRCLYFMSFEDGYFPYDLDRGQVLWMTEIFEKLIDAVRAYRGRKPEVDFANAMMYFADAENGIYEGREWPLKGFMIRELVCPVEAENMLKTCEHSGDVIEFDVFPTGMPIKMDTKPESPKIIAAVNSATGNVVLSELTTPDKITDIQAFDALVKWMSENGIPKRIKVSNPVVASMISDLCRKTGTDLRPVERLVKLGTVKENLLQYIRSGGR